MRKIFVFSLIILFLLSVNTFATEDFLSAIQGMQAIRDVSKTEPIMLDPESKGKIKTVYVEVSNSSNLNIDLDTIKNSAINVLKEKGYTLCEKPEECGYIVQIDLTKINIIKEKKSSFFGSLLGGIAKTTLGIAGALAGSKYGINESQIFSQVGASAGEMAGSAIGGNIDNALSGENYSYLGSMLILIKEKKESQKEYKGQYPLAGNSKEIEGSFTNDLANKISKVIQSIF